MLMRFQCDISRELFSVISNCTAVKGSRFPYSINVGSTQAVFHFLTNQYTSLPKSNTLKMYF